MKFKGKLTGLMLAGAVAASFAPVAMAGSSNSGVYGITPKAAGWCPNPAPGLNNYVTYVNYINYTTGDSGGDYGDDIVWMRVANGRSNSVQVNVMCKWTTPIGRMATFTPTRYGQSVWFGFPGGIWTN